MNKIASPPKENHKIEIKCNRQDIGLSNNNLHNIIENPTIYKKLKQIHDKIKRLNKTLTDSNVDNHKTKLFLAANNKKFLNMTNNIGVLGKRIQNQKTATSTVNPTANPAVTAAKELEDEIEQFFASKSELNDQLDELDRKLNEKESSKTKKKNKGDSLEEKIMQLKNKKPALTLHDLNDDLADEQAQALKKSANNNSNKNKSIFSKEKKLDLSNKNKLVDELLISKENEADASKKAHTAEQKISSIINSMKEEKAANNKKNKKLFKNLDQASENDWLKALDSLNEELDLGEKILFNKESKENLPSSEKKKAPDSLVELMSADDTAQIAHLNAKASFDAAAASANAHLQPLKTSHETQSTSSNSTGMLPFLTYSHSIF